jgi:hypothetical protein
MNNVQRLADLLQRAKTLMETTELSGKFKGTYTDLSRVLFNFEQQAKVSAAAIRDAEDERIMGIHVPDEDCACATCGKTIPAGQTAVRVGNDIYHDGQCLPQSTKQTPWLAARN